MRDLGAVRAALDVDVTEDSGAVRAEVSKEEAQEYEREEDIEAAFETQEQNTETAFDKRISKVSQDGRAEYRKAGQERMQAAGRSLHNEEERFEATNAMLGEAYSDSSGALADIGGEAFVTAEAMAAA